MSKGCPECSERVKEAANVCRFCGYRFDSEQERLRQTELAERPWWKKTATSLADAASETSEERQAKKSRPQAASCCGCSCGGVLAVLTVATGAFVVLAPIWPMVGLIVLFGSALLGLKRRLSSLI